MSRISTPGETSGRLWTKAFFTISLAALCTSVAAQMVSNNMSLYVNELHGTATFTGLLMTVFTFSAIISRLVNGYLLDHKDKRLVMIGGCLVFFLATISYDIFPYLKALPVLRVIQGFGFATASTATAAAIVDVLPKERFAEGLGYYSLAWAVATAIGPSLGLYLIFGQDYSFMFWGSALVIILACLFYISNNFNKDRIMAKEDRIPGKTSRPKGISIWDFIEKKALFPSSMQAIISMASCSVFIFVTLFAKTKGIEQAGLFYIIMAVFMMISRIGVGRLIDKKGPLFVIIPSQILCILSYLILAFTDSAGVFLLAGALFGFSTGISTPAFNSEAVRYVSPFRRGAASATYLIAIDTGFGIGAALGGMVIDYWGFRCMYLLAMTFVILSMIICIKFMSKKAIVLESSAAFVNE